MSQPNTPCAYCVSSALCMPCGLNEQEIEQLDQLMIVRKTIQKGDCLFQVGTEFQAIYAVHSGFFKTDILFEDGRTQITGFQMEGDILGLDGFYSKKHSCNAIALENSKVCVIPYAHIDSVSQQVQSLQHHLNQVLSREIVQNHQVMLLLGTMRAEERLAAFLLNLSERFRHRGFSGLDFYLKMNREEIGDFLGLKLETVSRVFSRFEKENLIMVQNKHIQIKNLKALKALLLH